jgi:dTDP-4-amino-4,6-dideoxy-D-galactose acyltransferase
VRRPWDSEFFGPAIGEVTSTPDPVALTAAVDAARRGGVDCLYLLVDAADVEAIGAAEGAGFSLVDVRLTMRRDDAGAVPGAGLTASATVTAVRRSLERRRKARRYERDGDDTTGRIGGHASDGSIRPAREDDIAAVEALARVSHRNTRFYRDRRFDRSRSDDMYAVWIARSIRGEFADAVWVADVDGAPRGYITVARREADAAIGLVAVADAYRGRGYGERLMQAAIRWADQNNLPSTSVVTQGTSASSVRFYERAGFRASRIELWYHCWLDSGTP